MEKIDFTKQLNNIKECIIFEIKNLLKGLDCLDLANYTKDKHCRVTFQMERLFEVLPNYATHDCGDFYTAYLYRLEKHKGMWIFRWSDMHDEELEYYGEYEDYTPNGERFNTLSVDELNTLYERISAVLTTDILEQERNKYEQNKRD